MKNKIKPFIACTVILLCCFGCTEEIAFKTETLESALVVEAVITNENKNHVVKLSRTYAFETEGPIPETDATVTIESDTGVVNFQETTAGIYVASSAFAAQSNTNYTLLIRTNDGKQYSSTPVQLTPSTPIARLYAERVVDDVNEDGMTIFVDAFDPEGRSQFYRFEYEETYKIIAPLWRLEDLIVIDPSWPACSVAVVPKKEEKRVCFASDTSTAIIIGNTTALSEDRLQRFPVRRIREDNYILSHRYSILVKQFVQSRAAYTYYETLQEFSGEGSLFSQSQPGFFDGNIISESNNDEKVVGFFEASFVSSERLFFNYTDFFPNEPLPPYASGCTLFAPPRDLGHPTDRCGSLITGLQNGEIVYVSDNPNPESVTEGPYIMAATACGDCTVLGSNIIPEFWAE